MNKSELSLIRDPESLLVRFEPNCEESKRKVRLVAVACCRRLWHLLPEPHQLALEIAEKMADPETAPRLSEAFIQRLADTLESSLGFDAPFPIAQAASYAIYAALPCLDFRIHRVFGGCATALALEYLYANHLDPTSPVRALSEPLSPDDLLPQHQRIFKEQSDKEMERFCQLILEIYGHRLYEVRFASEWLTWNNGQIEAMARKIYKERSFAQMPILGDALEEAGCDNAAISEHCRSNEVTHVRGCWVIDLLLGKA